jgi:hypothetical protein
MFNFSHKHDLNVINFYVILNGQVGNANIYFFKMSMSSIDEGL